MLDPLDNTASPSTDILAVYTRTIGFDLEMRIDLLDLPLVPDYHLQILLDTNPGGNPWDLVIDIPAQGSPTVTPATPGLIPRVIRDPWLDTVTVRINRQALPRPFTMKVVSFVAGESNPADETVPVRSDALPPTQRAPLVLAFWDVFPASTPAQALRLLDGAHTGPLGERHGLKHVLDAAGQYDIPVALLDLTTPTSLAALNYMGILPQIRNLDSRNLLILPEVAYGDPATISFGFSKRAADGFNLATSQFVYSTSGTLVDSLAQFFPLDNNTQLASSGRTRLIPLPAADDLQATQDGPSLDVRRALVDAAFSGDSSHLVVLGGDLPRSTWGNEDIAGPTFAWLAAHPWIQPLNGEDLMTFPLASTIQRPTESPIVASPFLAGLNSAPHNSLTDSAWQTYFMLTSPTTDENLTALRANYLGQVDELLAAARWAEHPYTYTGCDQDLNSDGQPECVVSDLTFFAILSPVGARMTNLFYLDGNGPHQLVGPSSQFTIGLSDPSEWQPDLGQAADPSVIPGAFSDNTQIWMVYTSQITPGSIEFTSPDGSRVKNYKLLQDGLEIKYNTPDPVSTRIPLAVDSQGFYFEPTGYTGTLTSNTWTWKQTKGIMVSVSATSPLSVESFTDSLPYLSQPENPDRTYPAGHYLPFPLSVIDIQGNDLITVRIIVK
ncbi:MAG: hypothetical protein ABSG01_13825 [Anaerolineales bacterium]